MATTAEGRRCTRIRGAPLMTRMFSDRCQGEPVRGRTVPEHATIE